MHERWRRSSIKAPWRPPWEMIHFSSMALSNIAEILLHGEAFSHMIYHLFIYIPAVRLHTTDYYFFFDFNLPFMVAARWEPSAWLYMLVCLCVSFQGPPLSSSQYTSRFICAGISEKLSSRNTQTEKLLNKSFQYALCLGEIFAPLLKHNYWDGKATQKRIFSARLLPRTCCILRL